MGDTIFELQYADTVTSLSKAAEHGNLRMVKTLLKKGRLPQTPDNRGWCSVHCCVASNQLEALKLILNSKKRDKKYLSNICTWKGESPLVIALKKDVSRNIVKFLLESGASTNVIVNNGKTALHYACQRSTDKSNIKLLIDYGALVDIKDNIYGYTPLHFAIERNNLCAVRLLVNHADINLPDVDNETPLYKACVCNFLEAVRLILMKDQSSVNIIPRTGFSPLNVAALQGNLDMVRLVFDAGGDAEFIGPAHVITNTLQKKKFLPIHSSVFKNVDVFKFFLLKSNPFTLYEYDKQTCSGTLSIFTVLYSHNTDFIETLLQHTFPPDFASLKTAEVEKLTELILSIDNFDFIVDKIPLFFKYYSNFHAETVFDVLTNSVINRKDKVLELCKLYHVLAKKGVSSGKNFNSKNKIINIFRDKLGNSQEDGLINETITILQQPVLTLKQLSRVALRCFIRSRTESDWTAFIAIRDSNMPFSLKNYLLYEE